jgi:hypothetical protein
MTFSKIAAFERFFDRSVVVYFVGLGLVLAGSMAFIGG